MFKKNIIRLISSFFIFLLLHYNAIAEKYNVTGYVVDNDGRTINGINVSLINKNTGKEYCKTMSKQVFEYPNNNNFPKLLQIPILSKNGYIEMVCDLDINDLNDLKENIYLNVNEGTFYNIKGGSLKIKYNPISQIKNNELTIGKGLNDNYRLILKKDKTGKYYYDFLNDKGYIPSKNDLTIDYTLNNLSEQKEKFLVGISIKGDFSGETLGYQVDGINYLYSKGISNVLTFDRIGKFEKDLAIVNIKISGYNYNKNVIIENKKNITIELPNNKNMNDKEEFAIVKLSNETKDYLFSNSNIDGSFEGIGTYDNGKIINYSLNKKGIFLKDNQYFYYNICKIDNCPRYLKLINKDFLFNGRYYSEIKSLNNESEKIKENKKESKSFFSQANIFYNIFFIMFIIFTILYIVFGYIGINKIKSFFKKK